MVTSLLDHDPSRKSSWAAQVAKAAAGEAEEVQPTPTLTLWTVAALAAAAAPLWTVAALVAAAASRCCAKAAAALCLVAALAAAPRSSRRVGGFAVAARGWTSGVEVAALAGAQARTAAPLWTATATGTYISSCAMVAVDPKVPASRSWWQWIEKCLRRGRFFLHLPRGPVRPSPSHLRRGRAVRGTSSSTRHSTHPQGTLQPLLPKRLHDAKYNSANIARWRL